MGSLKMRIPITCMDNSAPGEVVSSIAPPRYSLVIATLNDSGSLADCLASMVGIDPKTRFEVIIVDQNGDDRVVSLVAQFAGQLDIVHERVAFRGACRARNLGSRLARGEWLGFPDDDCQLLPDTLSEVEKLASDPQIKVVTGQTIDSAGTPNMLRWEQKTTEFSRWNMFECLTEATLFVRRDAFWAAGGFDECFGPGTSFPAAEGIDLMNRLFSRFGDDKAWYSPRIRMLHPTKIPPWNRWAVGRFHAYARGDGALIAKNPQSHMLYWGLRTVASATLQTLAFSGWRSIAYGARLIGLFSGLIAFKFRSGRT